jgi:SNF family Na+-dependent transporter
MKKIIVPIFIGIISVIIFISYAKLILDSAEGIWFLYLIAVGSLACAVAMIYIVIQRIREIKEGEYDDLSKY